MNCKHDPKAKSGKPLELYKCPECKNTVVIGYKHPPVECNNCFQQIEKCICDEAYGKCVCPENVRIIGERNICKKCGKLVKNA